MVADAVPAASAETHRLRKSGEHITFGSLKQVTTRGMGTRTEDVPSCPLGYPHLVDNSICFPHSYPQYVDNLVDYPQNYPQNVDNLFFYPHFAFCVSWR